MFEFDYYDPAFIDSPWETWRILRDEHPAYYLESLDAWLLTRYDTVYSATRDPGTFSSAEGNVFPEDNPNRIGRTLGTTDPPRHEELRRLTTQAFTPRRIAQLEENARNHAKALCEQLAEKGEFDFVEEYAGVYTGLMIGQIIGVPEEDVTQLRHWLEARFGPDPLQHLEDRVREQAKVYDYLGSLVAERRRAPGDNVLDDLIKAQHEGAAMSDEEIVITCGTILSAGFGTTKHALANMLVTLAEHPETRRELRDDPALVPQAFEEALRYHSPGHLFARNTTRDVDVHGTTVPAGARVGLVYGAANRDERAFPDPDRFDIHRSMETRHLAFGFGTHFCLGAPLARLEARATFDHLLPIFGDYEVFPDPANRVNTPSFRGFTKLDCRVP